jgi:sporulation protein YlmC with PRC-barrel domain
MSTPIDLGLGVLDHQVVDSEGRRCGKVDDLELAGVRDGAPSVEFVVVGRRRRVRVPWSEVEKIDSAVHLRKPAHELRLGRGDARAGPLVAWIPGAHRE